MVMSRIILETLLQTGIQINQNQLNSKLESVIIGRFIPHIRILYLLLSAELHLYLTMFSPYMPVACTWVRARRELQHLAQILYQSLSVHALAECSSP